MITKQASVRPEPLHSLCSQVATHPVTRNIQRSRQRVVHLHLKRQVDRERRVIGISLVLSYGGSRYRSIVARRRSRGDGGSLTTVVLHPPFTTRSHGQETTECTGHGRPQSLGQSLCVGVTLYGLGSTFVIVNLDRRGACERLGFGGGSQRERQ